MWTVFRTPLGVVWACVLSGLVWAGEPAPDSQPSKRTAGPSLDQRLSDDLDRELLQDLPGSTKPAGPDSNTKKPSGQPATKRSELDRQLLDQLQEGEDLGEKAQDPLLLISRRMRKVETRISQQDTAESTQRMQQQIVAELDEMIEQLKKQCAGGQCDKSGGKPKPGSKPGSGKKAGAGENTGTNKPAKDSQERQGPTPETQAELAAMRSAHKELWGHLPPKLREQVQSALVEQFLPKYEQLIESYYKRLAEERNN